MGLEGFQVRHMETQFHSCLACFILLAVLMDQDAGPAA